MAIGDSDAAARIMSDSLKIIDGSVIGGGYWKYMFTGDGNSGGSRGFAP